MLLCTSELQSCQLYMVIFSELEGGFVLAT